MKREFCIVTLVLLLSECGFIRRRRHDGRCTDSSGSLRLVGNNRYEGIMKKFFAILFAIAMFAAACGSDGAETATESDSESSDSSDSESSDSESSDSGDGVAAAAGLTELNVAYFLEWPTAQLVPLENGVYDEVMGVTVNWIPFASGNDMAVAMEAGDIDIAYSQGLTPFANFVTGGSDLVMVGVAVAYAEADNCAANPDLGITAENAKDTLVGQSIYTPLGNVTHFKLLKMLEFLEVDTSTVTLIQSEGAPAAVAALEAGEVALACAFGGSVNQMINNGGNLLMTGAEQEAIGIRVFDITSTTGPFADEYPEVVTAFLQVTEDANAAYGDDLGDQIELVAESAGMDVDATEVLSGQMSYPSIDEQLSDAWLGGTVAEVMKEQMDFFVEQGEIEGALSDYSEFVDSSFLEAVEQ